MADLMSNISAAAFIAAGLFFILAVFLWFKFRVLSIINDLSGRTARKSIEQMRAMNSGSDAGSHVPGTARLRRARPERGTGRASVSYEAAITAKLYSKQPDKPDTELLVGGTEENINSAELIEENSGTSEFTAAESVLHGAAGTGVKTELRMIEDIMLIHTEEVI